MHYTNIHMIWLPFWKIPQHSFSMPCLIVTFVHRLVVIGKFLAVPLLDFPAHPPPPLLPTPSLSPLIRIPPNNVSPSGVLCEFYEIDVLQKNCILVNSH